MQQGAPPAPGGGTSDLRAAPGALARPGRVRWSLTVLAALAPPGLNLVPLAAIWVVVLGPGSRLDAGLAAGLSVVALVGNYVLYAVL